MPIPPARPSESVLTDRLLNFSFTFLIIVLFVLYTGQEGRIWFYAALVLGSIFVLFALLYNLLTIDGAGAALMVAVASMGFGQWIGSTVILFFFFSSYGLHWWFNKQKSHLKFERRDGMQVWANAFWFVFFLALYYVYEQPWMILAAVASVASATSDTWSSIVGVHLSDTARMITTFRNVPPGTDGAISLPGTLAAAAGAFSVAIVFLAAGLIFDIQAFLVIFAAGITGCLADSLLGAVFQEHKMVKQLFPKSGNSSLSSTVYALTPDNNGVNFLSTGIAALTVFFFYPIY